MAWCVCVGIAHAAEISVPNASFESPTTPPGFPAIPQVDDWQKPDQPAWFDPASAGIQWDQLSGVFPNTAVGSVDHITNVDGNQAAYMFTLPEVALFQELETTFEVGLSYQLTAGILGGGGIAEGSGFELGLYYLDGLNTPVTVATTPITYSVTAFPTATEFIDFAVNLPEVQAGDAWAGQNIGIRLLSTSGGGEGYWDLDNVRLQAIPEPGTMSLLAIGIGGCVFGYRRPRRRSAADGGQAS